MKPMYPFLCFLLVGCGILPSVGPDYEAPNISMPVSWSPDTGSGAGESSEDLTAQWWKVFKEEQLDRLIDIALANNRQLKVAESRLLEAGYNRDIAVAGFFPQTTGTLDAVRRKFSINSFQGFQAQGGGGRPGIDLINENYAAAASSTWELDLFGGLRRGYEAVDAQYGATEEQLRGVLITLLADLVSTYFEVKATEKRIAIAHRNIDTQAQTLDIITKWREAGLSSGLDVAQTNTQYQQTKATLPIMEASLVNARSRLSVLLGIFPQELETIFPKQDPTKATDVASQIPDLVLSGVPSDLLRNRPDIKAAERDLAAASANVGVAVSDLFPKFTLSGDIGLQSLKKDTFLEAASEAWNVGVGVKWPIFSAFQLLNRVRVQDLRTEQAAALYEQTVLNALSEGESSLSNFDNEKKRLSILKEANVAASEAVRLSSEQYKAGLIDLLRVLEAQRSAFVTEEAVAISEQRIATSLVSSYKALGFGWQGIAPQAEES